MVWRPVPLPSVMSEAKAAAEIAARYHDGLYRYAVALTRGNRQEAFGIVQQTYLEILEGRADLLKAENPRAFLFGVARRQAASRQRRRSIFGRILGLELRDAAEPSTPGPESQAAQGEQVAMVRQALNKLPAKQLEAVTLVFMEDMTVEEAAKIMGVSVGSARTHYHRAKKRLSKLLEEANHD